MARRLPITLTLPIQKLRFAPATVAFFIILTAVVSAVTFLCCSHREVPRSLRRKEGKKRVLRLGGDQKKPRVIQTMKSSLSGKAHLMAKAILRKVQDKGEAVELVNGSEEEKEKEGGDEDGVVWKKTIIRGVKCRPIDFSGEILYDCDENHLPH